MDGEPLQTENNWNKEDVITIISWVTIGRKKIREMELIVDHNRYFMRQVTFYNLIFSSASGTVGVATIENASLADTTRFWCNVAVVVASFLITICTGALKICQVQENLELAIKYKQDWISFAAEIASEIQLPDRYRRESQFVINKNRAKYLELLKLDIEVPDSVTKKMKEMIDYEQMCLRRDGSRGERDSSSLVDILANIIDYEHMKFETSLEPEDYMSDDSDKNYKLITDFSNETELRKKALRYDIKAQSAMSQPPANRNLRKALPASRTRSVSNRRSIDEDGYSSSHETRIERRRRGPARITERRDTDTKDTRETNLKCTTFAPPLNESETDSDGDIENPRKRDIK